MHWKVDLTAQQAKKLLQGEGVNLKYFQLINGTTTIHLDHLQAERLARAMRYQKGFHLCFSPPEMLHHKKKGDGIFGTICKGLERFFAGPSSHASPAVRQTLHNELANVVKAWVYCTPLSLIVKFVALWFSEGKLDDKRRELNANDVYHCGFIFELDNGKQFRVQKNHVVEITEYHPSSSDELLPVGLSRRIPMEQWILNAEQNHGALLFQYTLGQNNCSRFCEQLLSANPIAAGSLDRLYKFIHQESEQLYSTLNQFGQTLGNAATNLAGRLDRVVNGDGVTARKSAITRTVTKRRRRQGV